MLRQSKPVTITYPCNQRGCDHAHQVVVETRGREQVDGGYDLRFHLSDEAEADLRARAIAHLDHHIRHGCCRRVET